MARDVGVLRLDRALVDRGLATSRSRAQELVRRGKVFVRGCVELRPSTLVGAEDVLTVEGDLPFVSRGGDKLAGALDALAIDVRGRDCLDVGASTGGFTDCLLQRGAARVCAVDVGRDQLAPALRTDPRVVVMDGKNVRELGAAELPFPPELTVVDASFISIETIAVALAGLVAPPHELLALVKPQFEVGPRAARRLRGVVREGAARDQAIARAVEALASAGFQTIGSVDSVLAGPRGNIERFIHARR